MQSSVCVEGDDAGVRAEALRHEAGGGLREAQRGLDVHPVVQARR